MHAVNRMARAALAVFLTATATSCMPNKAYHPVCEQRPCSTYQIDSAVTEITETIIQRNGWGKGRNSSEEGVPTRFNLAWLEYDESGEIFYPEQLDSILRKIDSIDASGKNMLVFIYVHGWHNNADNASTNDENYDALAIKNALARVTDSIRRLFEQDDREPAPEVLGIFVGWRGESTKVPLLSQISISDRSRAADRLGKPRDDGTASNTDGMKENIRKIANSAFSKSDRNRIIILGHSLGGRALTTAFINDLVDNDQVINRGVLVATANAAVSASCYASAFAHNRSSARPAWINMTSTDDRATRWLYPTAVLARLVASCADKESSLEEKIKTVGHYDPYITERLHLEHAPSFLADKSNQGYHLSSTERAGEIIANRTDWYRAESLDGEMAYRNYDERSPWTGRRRYDPRDDKENNYRIRLTRTSAYPKPQLIHNVSTDCNLIGRFKGCGKTSSDHNGFVSTNLIRLLVEAAYATEAALPPVDTTAAQPPESSQEPWADQAATPDKDRK